MVEHALPEAALAAEAALAGEAARAAHMEGVTAAQEAEGITWIANAMAAAEHEFAHARPRLPVRIDTGRDVVLSNEAPPVEPRPFANGTPVVPAADFKGVCIWCWERGHESKRCKEKQSPDMSDKQREAPAPRTRHDAAHIKKIGARAAAPTQKAYHSTYMKRNRQLIKTAEERLKAHHAELWEPLVGNGPFGQFTVYQLLAYEFVLGRPKPRPNQNASLLQLFARHLKGGVVPPAFASPAALRASKERAITDFVALHGRLAAGTPTYMHELLDHAIAQEKRKQPSVKVPTDASLLDVLKAAAVAARPKRGRPPSVPTQQSTSITVAKNWADGGYTVEVDARMSM